MAQPMLIRKLTCVEDWDYISRSCVPSVTLFANMFGSVLGGIIVDKVGRRPTLLVSSFIALMAGSILGIGEFWINMGCYNMR